MRASDRLRSWFVSHDVLGIPGEVVLDGTAGVGDVLATVLARWDDRGLDRGVSAVAAAATSTATWITPRPSASVQRH